MGEVPTVYSIQAFSFWFWVYNTVTKFYNKSVDSQPTNIISAAVGIGAGYALGGMATAAMIPAAPLIVVLAVGWIAGLGAQWAIINTGLDKKIGNALKIENEKWSTQAI